MKRRTKRLMYASFFACLLLLAFAWYGAFSYRSVCTSCGGEELATDWQIPFTRVTYWQSRSERDTPLSRVVSRYGLAQPGVHTWLFAQGHGNGAMCALGDGHLITRNDSPEVAAFIEAVARYRGAAEAKSWLGRLLDPKQSLGAAQVIRLAGVPPGGFGSRDQFESWQTAQGNLFSLYFQQLAGTAAYPGAARPPATQPIP